MEDNEDFPPKRGNRRERRETDSGKRWGEPIKWPHEVKEEQQHGDREPVPVRRGNPPAPLKRELPLP